MAVPLLLKRQASEEDKPRELLRNVRTNEKEPNVEGGILGRVEDISLTLHKPCLLILITK